MSKRHEPLEDALIEFMPQGATSDDEPADMTPVMVVGNPYAGAGVIGGGWDGIEEFLTRALAELRRARVDEEGWRKVVTEHLDDEGFERVERESLLAEAMSAVGGELPAEPAPVGSRVHVLTWDHRKGMSQSVHATAGSAEEARARIVRDNWDDFADRADLPAKPPADDDEALRLYEEAADDESFHIESLNVIA